MSGHFGIKLDGDEGDRRAVITCKRCNTEVGRYARLDLIQHILMGQLYMCGNCDAAVPPLLPRERLS
jgi:hypothetical protein